MKRTIAALAALCTLVVPTAASADTVYGTMQIPYADFYAAEGLASEVDAVSSATDSKWKNPSFNAGAYIEAHTEDGGGEILGIVYPVAIDEADLAALGENTCGFIPAEETPAAFKTVQLSEGSISFSAISGSDTPLEVSVELITNTVWGDYELQVHSINNKEGTSDIGTVCGALLKCSDGSVYAMRHLENIWQDKLGWSCGILTVEPHGNTMRYEQYADMMGKTITAITYITDTGYHTIDTELYVPVKFEGGVTVSDAPAADVAAAVVFDRFPGDYSITASVEGLDARLEGTALLYADAIPGAYTLTVRDASGRYADVLASFVLTTEELPVAYDADHAALSAVNEAFAPAFLANITEVEVNETVYKASGKGAVAIIDEDGAIDPEAAVVQGRGAEAVSTPVFTSGEEYSIVVHAAGYPDLSFTYRAE